MPNALEREKLTEEDGEVLTMSEDWREGKRVVELLVSVLSDGL